MVIKSGKNNSQVLILLSVATVLCPVLLTFQIPWEDAEMARVGICCCGALFGFFALDTLRYWIATGKTIIMSKEGCSIVFLWYRRYYRWDELQMKQFASYADAFGFRSPFLGGAEFSPKALRKPKWLNALEYCQWVHPISFFFVYFRPDIIPLMCEPKSDIYVVDEMEFRAKLKEWGVSLSEA